MTSSAAPLSGVESRPASAPDAASEIDLHKQQRTVILAFGRRQVARPDTAR